MNNVWKAAAAAVVMILGQSAMAEEAAVPAADAPAAADAAAPIQVSATGEQVVTVSTGNETVDAAANLAARCIEKTAAMQACGGGFKGIACKKTLEMTKYKGLECPGE